MRDKNQFITHVSVTGSMVGVTMFSTNSAFITASHVDQYLWKSFPEIIVVKESGSQQSKATIQPALTCACLSSSEPVLELEL